MRRVSARAGRPGSVALHRERDARHHQGDAVGGGGHALVHETEEVAEPEPDPASRDARPRRPRSRRGRGRAPAPGTGTRGRRRRRAIAAWSSPPEQAVRDPEGQAVEDGDVDGSGEPAAGAHRVPRRLDGEPVRRALGTVAGDPRGHVGVERLGGGHEGHPAMAAGEVLARGGSCRSWRRPARGGRSDARSPGSSLEDRSGRSGSPGRSPGSRIALLPTPSRPGATRASGLRGFRPRLQ